MPAKRTSLQNHFPILLASIGVLCLIALGVVVFATYQVRARYEAQATLAAQNVTGLLSQGIAAEIAKADVVLRSVVEDMEDRLADGKVDRDGINRHIARMAAMVPELFAVRVVDADGIVRYGVDRTGTPIPKEPSVSVGDRPYFLQARTAPKSELIFTPPFVGRVITTPVMQLVRRISHPDGSFAGVAYIAFDVATLNRLISSVELGPHGLSSLRMIDNTVVARYSPSSPDETLIGKKVVVREFVEAIERHPDAGTYQAASPNDTLLRRFAFRKVPGYPGYVITGIAQDDIASGWRTDLLILGALLPVFLIAVGLCVWTARSIGRRLEQRYTEALMNATGDAALLLDEDGIVLATNTELAGRFGLSVEELVGRPFFDLLPPELATARHEQCQRVFATREPLCHIDERNGLVLENLLYPVPSADGGVRTVAVYSRDITEKTRMQQQLVQLKDQYQLLFADSPDAYLIMALGGGRILECNRAAEILLGGERQDIVGKTPDQLSPPLQPDGRTSLASVPEKIEATLKNGHHRFDWVHRRLNGNDFWAEVSISLSTYQNRKVLFVSWRDISDRKRAEGALAESEERFRTLVEGTSDWVWESDANHCFTWFSDSFESILGFPSSHLIGKRRWEAASQDGQLDVDLWQEHMEALALHRSFRDFRYWIGTESDEPRWLSVSGAPRFNEAGEFIGYRGSASDITDQANQALRLRMLSTAVEQSPVAAFITDTDGRIEYVNRAFVTNTGYSVEEAIGQTPRLLSSGDTPIEVYRDLWETISSGKPWSGELCNRHKNGETRWDAIRIAPIQDDFGKIIHYVALEEDITERRALHENLRKTNAELEQFAYIASHDLRQPLRMITSYLGLLDRQLSSQLSDDQKGFIGFAVDGAKRLDALIVGLLEYSRTGRNAQFGPVNLAEVAAESVNNLTLAATDAGGKVEVGVIPAVIQGDRIEIVRLFQNLIGNALKYSAPDRPPVVRVQCRRDRGEWIVSIADNGIGIAPEDQERVFAIFQRLVTREQYDGTGIGLAVCKKIVEHHGGRIWIASEIGKGSTFFVAFPAIGS